MECPECKHKTIVIDSRERGTSEVYRRRECLKCRVRISTREYVTDVQRGGKHDDSRH